MIKKQSKKNEEVLLHANESSEKIPSDIEDVDDVEIISDDDGMEASKLKKVKKELERCKKEKQEYLNGWQRTKADHINALRRFEQDVEKAKNIGVQKSIKVLLPVLESLNRAESTHGKLPDGFSAIAKQLTSAFTAVGVIKIEVCIGDIFNPTLHEALSRNITEDASKDNTISAVLETGWKLHEDVIQPAKVSVAYCK